MGDGSTCLWSSCLIVPPAIMNLSLLLAPFQKTYALSVSTHKAKQKILKFYTSTSLLISSVCWFQSNRGLNTLNTFCCVFDYLSTQINFVFTRMSVSSESFALVIYDHFHKSVHTLPPLNHQQRNHYTHPQFMVSSTCSKNMTIDVDENFFSVCIDNLVGKKV